LVLFCYGVYKPKIWFPTTPKDEKVSEREKNKSLNKKYTERGKGGE
jgi:hypothetical protein